MGMMQILIYPVCNLEGVAVQAPYGVDGHTVTVSLPQGATGMSCL